MFSILFRVEARQFEQPTKTRLCSDKFHGGKKASLFEHPYIYSLARPFFWWPQKVGAPVKKGLLEDRQFGLTVVA